MKISKHFILYVFTPLIIASCFLFCANYTKAEYFKDVILTGIDGIYVDSRSYSTLNAAVAAVGSSDREIVIASPQTVTSLTIPSTARIRFTRTGAINNSGQLTISTPNIASDHRTIFTGAGDVDFTPGTEVNSSWFPTFNDAVTKTADDSVSLIVDRPTAVTTDCALGTDVNLKWKNTGNLLTISSGKTLSNVSKVDAGNYQIFAGSGKFTFTDGIELKLPWFLNLRAAITHIGTTRSSLTVTTSSSVDYSDTIPTNLQLNFINGGDLNLTGGITVTFASKPTAGLFQIFRGSGLVKFAQGTVSYLSPEWWQTNSVPGTTDMAVATNKAITSLTSNSVKGTIFFHNGAYRFASTVSGPSDIQIKGSGKFVTEIKPDAGISAFTIDGATHPQRIGITDLCVNAGLHGIYIYNGGYTTYNSFKNLYLANQTGGSIYVDGTDFQASEVSSNLISGGAYGIYLHGLTSSNANTWINNEVRDTILYGLYIDGVGSTYTTDGNLFLGCLFESNQRTGAYLARVNQVSFVNCWFEYNGEDLTGGPYPSIYLAGGASYIYNVTFQECMMSAHGPNQDDLVLQVGDANIIGPITLKNCRFPYGDEIIDMGTFASTHGSALVIEGHRPYSIIGDVGVGKTGPNLVRNGSFAYWNEGTSVVPTSWSLSATGAATRIAGPETTYAANIVLVGASTGLYQYKHEAQLKPNTTYTVNYKKRINSLTGAATVNAYFVNGGVFRLLETFSAVDSGWVERKHIFRTGNTVTASCGLCFLQSNTGTSSFDVANVTMAEGYNISLSSDNYFDATMRTGTVTLTMSATSTFIADARVSAGSTILLTAANAHGAAALAASYVGAKTDGSGFYIIHPSAAYADQNLNYVILN